MLHLYINLLSINRVSFAFISGVRALLFWFCCMTLLGCVPVENLAETGSNVKSAVESRTEQESLKRRLDVLKKKKGMMVTLAAFP